MPNNDEKQPSTPEGAQPSQWEIETERSLEEAQRRHAQARFQPFMTEEEHRRYDRGAYEHAHERRAAKQRRRRIAITSTCAAIVFTCAICFGIAKTVGSTGTQLAADQQQDEQAAIAQDQQQKFEAADDPGDIIIGVNGDVDTYVLRGESYIEGGAHAAAADSGVLTPDIQASGDVDTNTAGDYTVTYRVQDAAGHVAKAERHVHVVDSMDTMKTGVPVLMYHYVYSADNPPSELNGNYLLDTKLDEQMQYLNDNGYYYPSFPEVQAFILGKHSLPAKSVVLTFDDGEDGTLGFLDQLAAKHKIPVTSFMICSDTAAAANKVVQYASPYVEYESHSISMHQAGGTVGHGGRISAMTKDEIVSDLRDSATIVGSGQAFAYPFGDTTAEGQQAVTEAGLCCAFTTKNDWCYIGDDVTALNRVRISGEYTMDSFAILTSEE